MMDAIVYGFDVGEDALRLLSKPPELQEWENHIKHPREDMKRRAICGADIQAEFAFVSIDHAFNEANRGGRLTVCPVCAAIVRAAMARL